MQEFIIKKNIEKDKQASITANIDFKLFEKINDICLIHKINKSTLFKQMIKFSLDNMREYE